MVCPLVRLLTWGPMFWSTLERSRIPATPAAPASATCRPWRATCAFTPERSPTPWVVWSTAWPPHTFDQLSSVYRILNSPRALVCSVWQVWRPLPPQESTASPSAAETRRRHQHQGPLQAPDWALPASPAGLLRSSHLSHQGPGQTSQLVENGKVWKMTDLKCLMVSALTKQNVWWGLGFAAKT